MWAQNQEKKTNKLKNLEKKKERKIRTKYWNATGPELESFWVLMTAYYPLGYRGIVFFFHSVAKMRKVIDRSMYKVKSLLMFSYK